MKVKIILFASVFLLFINDIEAQKSKGSDILTKELNKILPTGKYLFRTLETKIIDSLHSKNKENTYTDPATSELKFVNPPRFPNNLFQKGQMQKESLNQEFSGKIIEVKIINTDSLLSFVSSNKDVPNFTINLATKILSLNNDTLEFDKNLHVTTKNNILKSEWTGFQWKSINTLENGTVRNYSVTIGKLIGQNKIYIVIQGYHKQSLNKFSPFIYRLLT